MHSGGSGENSAELALNCVHTVAALPVRLKPRSQLYIATSPIELPLNDTMPLSISAGSGHSAAEQESRPIGGKNK